MGREREREEPLWTLDELTARVALALSVDYDGQSSGRVREIPDARIIRYYTTLGIVDRPLGYDGRTAIYSTRHLLQIVAIKRLQQRGASLSQVQQVFLALDEKSLVRLAAGPAGPGTAGMAEAMSATSSVAAPAKEKFWNTAPAEPVTTPRAKEKKKETAAAPVQPHPGTLTGVPISDDAVVLAAFARTPDAQDLAALRTAAAPLLAELRKRGLL